MSNLLWGDAHVGPVAQDECVAAGDLCPGSDSGGIGQGNRIDRIVCQQNPDLAAQKRIA